MPFAVLLEVGLASVRLDGRLHGVGLDQRRRPQVSQPGRHRPPASSGDRAHAGTLTTRIRVTKITSTAGMILQHYDFAVHSPGRPGLRRHGRIRLFPCPRLDQQVGIRDAAPYQLSAEERARAAFVRVSRSSALSLTRAGG